MDAISGIRDGLCPGRQPSDRPGSRRQDRSRTNHPASARRGIAALALAGLALSFGQPARASSAVTIGGPFALMAANGTPVTDRTYRGRWLLVYFGYMSCPDSCPTALLDMADALKALGTDADKLQPIFVTIDPQRDTRAALADFAASFDPRIVALTGPPEAIDGMATAYGAYVIRRPIGPGPQDYLIDHSVYIYLMGPDGAFIRAFDPHGSGVAMAAAIRAAMPAAKPAAKPASMARGPNAVSLPPTAGSTASASGRSP